MNDLLSNFINAPNLLSILPFPEAPNITPDLERTRPLNIEQRRSHIQQSYAAWKTHVFHRFRQSSKCFIKEG